MQIFASHKIKMSGALSFGVSHPNQLQFNLDVPVTSDKMAAQFQRPRPILVERMSGLYAVPGNSSLIAPDNPVKKTESSFLLEDKMSIMTQLARRDIHRGNVKTQTSLTHLEPTARNEPLPSSPNICQRLQQRSAVRRQKPGHPVMGREAERNRFLGAVQTPPPQKPKPLDESVVNFDGNVSFLATNQDDFVRLISEMINYFKILQTFLERAIETDCNDSVEPAARGLHKDGFLYQEESTSRTQLRAEEHKVRCVRTVYNLAQKVKHIHKEIASCDMNNFLKKSHMTTQVIAIYRGAAKTLQMFMTQLPFQKLDGSLPPHYHELSALLRSLVALTPLLGREELSDQLKTASAFLDNIDKLNTKWNMKVKGKNSANNKKSISEMWVSDTKVDKNIFLMKDKPMVPAAMKKPANKAQKIQFSDRQTHNTHSGRGKENMFRRSKTGQVSKVKHKQKPITAETVDSADVPHQSLKDMQLSGGLIQSSQSYSSKPAKSNQQYLNKGTSSSSSEWKARTTSPFYVESLNQDDFREIFQTKTYKEKLDREDSFSTSEDVYLPSKDTTSLSIEDLRGTDMSGNSKLETSAEADISVAVHADSATLCDLPSFENIKLRLMEMQRERQEIQQRWSSFKFMASSQNLNSRAGKKLNREPSAVHVSWSPEVGVERKEFLRSHIERLVVKEPVLFTRPISQPVAQHQQRDVMVEHSVNLTKGRRLLTLKQTTVENIQQSKQQFERYLKSVSHHPSGKFNPWKLIEGLSDEIFMDCLQEVASELEMVNDKLAHHMFTSEFMVDKSLSDMSPLVEVRENFPSPDHRSTGFVNAELDRAYHATSSISVKGDMGQTAGNISVELQANVWNGNISMVNLRDTPIMLLDEDNIQQVESIVSTESHRSIRLMKEAGDISNFFEFNESEDKVVDGAESNHYSFDEGSTQSSANGGDDKSKDNDKGNDEDSNKSSDDDDKFEVGSYHERESTERRIVSADSTGDAETIHQGDPNADDEDKSIDNDKPSDNEDKSNDNKDGHVTTGDKKDESTDIDKDDSNADNYSDEDFEDSEDNN